MRFILEDESLYKHSCRFGAQQIFKNILSWSIKASLVSVFFLNIEIGSAAENALSNLYQYRDDKGIVYYTNIPDSENYSLYQGNRAIADTRDDTENLHKAKSSLELSGAEKEIKTTSVLPPKSAPITLKVGVKPTRISLPSGDVKKQEKKNCDESEKSSHNVLLEEKKISLTVPPEFVKKEILMASKQPDRLFKKKKGHSGELLGKIDRYIMQAAKQYRLSPSLVKAIIKTESNFNPHAVSPKGAVGLMQIMPSNFNHLNIKDPFDPSQNIMGGARYLRQMFDYFKGDVIKAIAAYNAGPANIEKANGIPDFKETQLFVQNVLKSYAQYDSQ